MLAVDALPLRAVEAANPLEIQYVKVDGKPLPFRGNGYKKGVKPADLAITLK